MNPYDFAEANEPTALEEELFDSFSEQHPELTNREVWELVERELESRTEDAAEYYEELIAESWRY